MRYYVFLPVVTFACASQAQSPQRRLTPAAKPTGDAVAAAPAQEPASPARESEKANEEQAAKIASLEAKMGSMEAMVTEIRNRLAQIESRPAMAETKGRVETPTERVDSGKTQEGPKVTAPRVTRPRAARPKAGSGTISGKVTLGKASPAEGAVVYLVGPGPTKKAKAEIHQQNHSFSPSQTVVPRGSTIDFPNDDKVFHNVFSVSKAARFDLGLYKAGSSKAVTFDRTGVVDVFCNIHPQMVAKIKVVDNAYYATVERDGRFTIKGVPAGKHKIAAWKSGFEESAVEVEVPSGGTTELALDLSKSGEATQAHLRKDGTPYGRYK